MTRPRRAAWFLGRVDVSGTTVVEQVIVSGRDGRSALGRRRGPAARTGRAAGAAAAPRRPGSGVRAVGGAPAPRPGGRRPGAVAGAHAAGGGAAPGRRPHRTAGR